MYNIGASEKSEEAQKQSILLKSFPKENKGYSNFAGLPTGQGENEISFFPLAYSDLECMDSKH